MEEINNISATQEKAETHNKKKSFKDLSPFVRNSLIAVIMVVVVFAVLLGLSALKGDNKTKKHDWFDVEAIGELTTIKCRYHNVAVYDKEKGWFGSGDQYVWMEYDVIVEVGIDTNKVKFEESVKKNEFRIYLPPAEILSAIEDKDTIFKPVCDIGAFADFTVEQERQIIAEGTEKLKNDEVTEGILARAHKSAKEIIEKYVIDIGKLIGEEYSVVWVDNPDEF